METVRKSSKVTGTLVVIIAATILLHHWYSISDYDYLDIVKGFMMTKQAVGGIHLFLIQLAFWACVVLSVVDAALNYHYAIDFISAGWIPLFIMGGLAILFIPGLGFTNVHLFWLICYILMAIGVWLSAKQVIKFCSKGTDLAKLLKDSEDKPEITANRVDFYAALALSVVAVFLAGIVAIGALIFGIGNRELIAGTDDVTPMVFSIRYDAAVELMEKGEYEAAMNEFRGLNGFNDSNTMAATCERLLYDPDYKKAVSLMLQGKYEEAISAFYNVYNYKDSANRIERCRDLQYGSKYDEAVALMEEGQYEDALEIFQMLSDVGYKDTYEQIEGCRSKMKLSLAGTWHGDAGSWFTLNEDMTCHYVDGGSAKGDGTWDVVDGRFSVKTSAFSYELYGYLDDGYLTTSILVKADSSSWRDETFTKD